MYQFDKNLISVSVDSGKSTGKYSWLAQNSEIQCSDFVTYAKEFDNENDFVGDSDLIEITMDGQEKSFLIGGRNDVSENDRNDTKLSEKHELSVLNAIGKVLTHHLAGLDLSERYNIDLSVNVPLEDFKTANIRNEYISKYLNREIDIKVNGKEAKFKIVQVSPNFESQGALIRNLNLVDREAHESLLLVVDIGSKNDTQMLFNKLRPVPGKNVMTNNGIHTSLQQLSAKMYNKYKAPFTIYQVEDILTGNNVPKNIDKREVEELFRPIATELVKKLKANTDSLGLNIQFTKLLFTGGSSIVLKPYIEEKYTEYEIYFSKDARFDNCKGSLIRALEKNSNGKQQ